MKSCQGNEFSCRGTQESWPEADFCIINAESSGFAQNFSILCLTTDVSIKVMRKKSVTSARSPRNTSAQPGDRYGMTSR